MKPVGEGKKKGNRHGKASFNFCNKRRKWAKIKGNIRHRAFSPSGEEVVEGQVCRREGRVWPIEKFGSVMRKQGQITGSRKQWFIILVSESRLGSFIALGLGVGCCAVEGWYLSAIKTTSPYSKWTVEWTAKMPSDLLPKVLKSTVNRSSRENGGPKEESRGKCG